MGTQGVLGQQEKLQISVKPQAPEAYLCQQIILGKIGIVAPDSFRSQLEPLAVWACAFPCFGSCSWQKQRGFWQTALIFFVSVWLTLIILQVYKVTAKIKSESWEADVDTSLFKSGAAEGLRSPWAMIHCLNEHPWIPHRWPGWDSLGSIREGSLLCFVRWEGLAFCCSSGMASKENGPLGDPGSCFICCCLINALTCFL